MGKFRVNSLTNSLHTKRSTTSYSRLFSLLKPRTRSDVTIWSLPEELLLIFLRNLHIRDLLKMRAVHPYFRDLIDENCVIWNKVSLENEWPAPANMTQFNKAANHSNFEAIIKLGIAYLYNEGLPGDLKGNQITLNGEKAALMFCKAETLTADLPPFTWLFIRPPWAAGSTCCKEFVFNNMKKLCEQSPSACLDICLSRVLQQFDDEEKQHQAIFHAQRATGQGSKVAEYTLWQHKYRNMAFDSCAELESMRSLRQTANQGQLEAILTLCKAYASRRRGGLNDNQALGYIRDFVQSSRSSNIQQVFKTNNQLTNSMRHILVDWLVEVAEMKDFTTETLHVAISVVDRYLKQRHMTRARLQLLGVSAMVVCSRFLGKDIITIREAAWLTDNTYKYEDVVKMMGEIITATKGRVRVTTVYDCLEVLMLLADLDKRTQKIAEYISDLVLLHADLSRYKMAMIAASCILLANLVVKKEVAWPSRVQEGSGFNVEDLVKCCLHINSKCFVENSVDHHHDNLEAIKQRYASDAFLNVSNQFKALSTEELCTALGVKDCGVSGTDLRIRFKNTKDLIMSPSRRGKPKHLNWSRIDEDRNNAATPTQEMEADYFNDSGMSGYYGDKEEDESFMECEDMDNDPEFEKLWCAEPTFGDPNESMTNPAHTTRIKSPTDFNQCLTVSNICMSSPEAAGMFGCSKLGQGHQLQKVGQCKTLPLPPTVTTRSSKTILGFSDLDYSSNLNNTNTFSIYHDENSANSEDINTSQDPQPRVYKTRLQTSGCLALKSTSGNVVSHSTNTSSSTSSQNLNQKGETAVAKRKCQQQIGNENKTRIMLHYKYM